MPTVETNGIETYYERRGSGRPIVFVHAAILDHSQSDPQVAALESEYETIVYDVRGHGRTGGSDREAYSMDLFAEDLAALVTALDLDDPIVCGHSTGGCIAQTYAARHPDRLSGLVLADTFSPELYDRLEWFQRVALLRAILPFVHLLGYQRIERGLVWLNERLSGRKAGGDYEKIRGLRAEGPTMSTAEFEKVIRAVIDFHETTVDLRTITVPTLVLYGANELPFVRSHAGTFAAELPNATVRTVPDAGHASNLDAPNAFTGALREFLAGLPASGDSSGRAPGAV